MHEYKVWNNSESAKEQWDNLIEICRSFLDATKGGSPLGKRASANGRYKVKEGSFVGRNEFGHFKGYHLAGVMFDLTDDGVATVSYPVNRTLVNSVTGERYTFEDKLASLVIGE